MFELIQVTQNLMNDEFRPSNYLIAAKTVRSNQEATQSPCSSVKLFGNKLLKGSSFCDEAKRVIICYVLAPVTLNFGS